MKIVNFNTDIKQFIGIFHIADIHIRLTKRHDEYKKVFDTLISDVLKSPENTCVVIAGDVFHSKSELSPECVQLASSFLKNLADIRPTVLFAGNHDATLSNKNRMDSLSPIVSAINHKNLYYLRDTGLYIFGDILFNHMSVFDDVENYIKCKDIPSLYKRQTSHLVALFHGPVDQALTDCGFLVSNRSITTDLFDGHDIAILGDIHTYQNLKTKDGNTDIVYASSLIQQNHGESLDGHGYVIWNLKNKSHLHINVKNECGFFTIDINKGKLNTDITNIPKKTRLRVRCFESIPSEVKAIIRDIEKQTELLEVTYVRVDTENSKSNEIVPSLNISDLSSVDFQNQLIHSFLKTKTSDVELTDEVFKKIFDINKYYNSTLDSDKIVKNIRWKPKKFEFSNMFSYGENNSIDFSKMKDVIGLFAPNTAGKSSLFSALSFCIFDKCDRAFKASHILNSQKMSFSCKFNFEIDNVDYFIERTGKSDKKGNVKVDVKFWKIVDDKVVELNGEARRSTNDLIRDFVGTYDDFILTSLSVQNNKAGSFVDMGQTERKDLLSQFMGLNIFDELYKKSSERLKEISVELKTLVKSDVGESIETSTSNIESYEEILSRLGKEYDSLLSEKNNLSDLVIAETRNIVKLDSSVPTDVNFLIKNKEITLKNINDKTEKIGNLKSEIVELKSKIENLKERLFEYKTIDDDFSKLTDLRNQKNNIERQIEIKKIFISSMMEKIHKLQNHEYDPNCKFCTNNQFVKDALIAKQSMPSEKTNVDDLLERYENIKKSITSMVTVDSRFREFQELKNNIVTLENSLQGKNKDVLISESELTSLNYKLTSFQNDIDTYYKRKDDIENNMRLQSKIDDISLKIKSIDLNLKKKQSDISDFNTRLTSARMNKKIKDELINKIVNLEKDMSAYQQYVLSVSRDGIPFDLISKAVPVIEKEVNDILSQIVDFGVSIQTDGKNVITNITYNDKKWPLELSSGLEKFLTSLALRVALINISNLPRPNFIAIDEGFGAADADNLSSMNALFSILKHHFDFIIVISHIDAMKDAVDTSLEIYKENGLSKIVY